MTQEEIDKELARQFPLMFFDMLEPQERFIRVKNSKGKTPRRRIFEAGNKCITANTRVSTPKGEIPVGRLWRMQEPFEVYAWNGKDKVVAKASAPFKKESLHECYRISFSDGTFVEAADYHRVLTDKGWLFVQHLYEAAFDPLESSSAAYLSVLPSGVLHLSETQSDFLDRCYGDSRQYDALLHFAADNDLICFPLRADALQPFRPELKKDVSGDRRTNIRRRLRAHLSSWYDHFQSAARCVGSSFRSVWQCAQPQRYLFQEPLQSSNAGDYRLQSFDGYYPQSPVKSGCYLQTAYQDTSSSERNKFITIKPIACQEVYDFTVDRYHNYFAGGLIHHNCGKTEIGIAEDIAHMMGFRPWLAEDDPDYKIDIKVPNVGLIIGETMVHSIGEKIEPTLRRLIPKTCAPVFKSGPTGVAIKVTLTYDWKGKKCGSVAYLRSNDQRADTFEGIDFHWLHGDEPPDEKVLTAAERGKVVTNSPSWYTMTPLKNPYFYDRYSSKAAHRC